MIAKIIKYFVMVYEWSDIDSKTEKGLYIRFNIFLIFLIMFTSVTLYNKEHTAQSIISFVGYANNVTLLHVTRNRITHLKRRLYCRAQSHHVITLRQSNENHVNALLLERCHQYGERQQNIMPIRGEQYYNMDEYRKIEEK